jgi:hypothetical protein
VQVFDCEALCCCGCWAARFCGRLRLQTA